VRGQPGDPDQPGKTPRAATSRSMGEMGAPLSGFRLRKSLRDPLQPDLGLLRARECVRRKAASFKSAYRTRPLAKSATSSQQATLSNPQSVTSTVRDTLQISSTAQAALKEVIETPALRALKKQVAEIIRHRDSSL
jgi:hypothetical protein